MIFLYFFNILPRESYTLLIQVARTIGKVKKSMKKYRKSIKKYKRLSKSIKTMVLGKPVGPK